MNRKITAFLLATALIAPMLHIGYVIADTKINLLSPRINTESSLIVTFTSEKEIKKGDAIKIALSATEAGQMPELADPGCTYSTYSHRRFNPGPKFLQKCKENIYAKDFAKMYLVEWQGDSVKLQTVTDFQDSQIPGFLLPPLPVKLDELNSRLNQLFGTIFVGGYSCSFETGSKLVNALSERSITIKSPLDFTLEQVKAGITVSIPEQFGIFCPATQGAYNMEISSGALGTIKQTINIYTPKITEPFFVISNTFPSEPANYTFTFKTSEVSILNAGQSNVKLMITKGFIANQQGNQWKVIFNGIGVSINSLRLHETPDHDAIFIPIPVTVTGNTKVEIVFVDVINPSQTGLIKCFGQTSFDIITTEFSSQEIKYEELATSIPPEGGMKARLTIRFISPGIFKGEDMMITLPAGSSFGNDPTLVINGKEYKRVSFGEKTAQMVLPTSFEKGNFMRLEIAPVINPSSESPIQVKTTSKVVNVSWRIAEFSPKLTVLCDPAVANSEASWEFSVTPPENLAADERKEITISGCFNRILKPASGEITILLNGNPHKATFISDTIKITFAEPFESKKTIRIGIPKNAGFGTPDRSCEFRAVIGTEVLTTKIALTDSTPIVRMRITDNEGKLATANEFGWFNKQIKLIFESSSGLADIFVMGLAEPLTSQGKNFEVEIKEPVLAKKLNFYATDNRGSSQKTFIPIMVDMEMPDFKVVSEEVSPMQNYSVKLEVNRKIIPIPDTKQFLVIEPSITIQHTTFQMKVDITDEKPTPTFTVKAEVELDEGENNLELTSTDQAGNKAFKTFKVLYNFEEIKFDFDAGQQTTLLQGPQTVKFITNPDTNITLGDKTTQSNSKGEISLTLNIAAGFNIFDALVTTKKGAKLSFKIVINGKRVIKMKIGLAQFDIDGKITSLKVPPMNNFKSEPRIPNYYNGFTFVPLKDLATALFGTVTYDEKTKMVSIIQKRSQGERVIKVKLGNPNAIIDGKEVPIQPGKLIAPVIIKGTSMVPLRFISENLGSVVGFDKASGSVTVTWPDIQKVPTPEVIKSK
jgi:hypothetical protein